VHICHIRSGAGYRDHLAYTETRLCCTSVSLYNTKTTCTISNGLAGNRKWTYFNRGLDQLDKGRGLVKQRERNDLNKEVNRAE